MLKIHFNFERERLITPTWRRLGTSGWQKSRPRDSRQNVKYQRFIFSPVFRCFVSEWKFVSGRCEFHKNLRRDRYYHSRLYSRAQRFKVQWRRWHRPDRRTTKLSVRVSATTRSHIPGGASLISTECSLRAGVSRVAGILDRRSNGLLSQKISLYRFTCIGWSFCLFPNGRTSLFELELRSTENSIETRNYLQTTNFFLPFPDTLFI